MLASVQSAGLAATLGPVLTKPGIACWQAIFPEHSAEKSISPAHSVPLWGLCLAFLVPGRVVGVRCGGRCFFSFLFDRAICKTQADENNAVNRANGDGDRIDSPPPASPGLSPIVVWKSSRSVKHVICLYEDRFHSLARSPPM